MLPADAPLNHAYLLVRCYRRLRSCCGTYPHTSTARTAARARGEGVYQIVALLSGRVIETLSIFPCPDETSGIHLERSLSR